MPIWKRIHENMMNLDLPGDTWIIYSQPSRFPPAGNQWNFVSGQGKSYTVGGSNLLLYISQLNTNNKRKVWFCWKVSCSYFSRKCRKGGTHCLAEVVVALFSFHYRNTIFVGLYSFELFFQWILCYSKDWVLRIKILITYPLKCFTIT